MDRVKDTAAPGLLIRSVVSAVCEGVPPVKFRLVTTKACPVLIIKKFGAPMFSVVTVVVLVLQA